MTGLSGAVQATALSWLSSSVSGPGGGGAREPRGGGGLKSATLATTAWGSTTEEFEATRNQVPRTLSARGARGQRSFTYLVWSAFTRFRRHVGLGDPKHARRGCADE